MGHKLRFGTSNGTGYTRAKFPTHLGVAKGPLNKMSDFDSTFARERDKQGPGGEFTYKGKRYTTDRADDKKTAISSAKTKDKDQIQQDQVDLTNSLSKIEKKPIQPIPNETKMKPIEAKQSFEETQSEIKAEKDAAKKEKRANFRKELGAGLEEAGATIAMAYGKGGTGTMTTANMAYKKMKEDLKTKRLLNERRAYMNTDAGNMELEGKDPVEKQDDKMKEEVFQGGLIKEQKQESDAANQAIVSENASIENRRDNNAGATDCPGGTCPAYE
jgi:hypothetical protein